LPSTGRKGITKTPGGHFGEVAKNHRKEVSKGVQQDITDGRPRKRFQQMNRKKNVRQGKGRDQIGGIVGAYVLERNGNPQHALKKGSWGSNADGFPNYDYVEKANTM